MAALTLRNILVSVFVRYPYFNGVSLLMLLAERAMREDYPFLSPYIVYTNVALFCMIGLCLSGKFEKKEIIGLYCLQLAYLSYLFYTSTRSKYQDWQKIRLCVRPMGLIGVYAVYANIMDPRQSIVYRKFGENILGIYLIAIAYMLVHFKRDQMAFYTHFIHSELLLYLFAGLVICCALVFLSGYYVRDGAYLSAVLMLFLIIIMETDLKFWERQGMESWNQVRTLGDGLCVVMGLLIIATEGRKELRPGASKKTK